jgi:hypothetical protein
MLIAHRINSIEELQDLENHVAIEFDIRDSNGKLFIEHDAFHSTGLELQEFLRHVGKRFMIVNIKSEGIEWEVLRVLKEQSIEDFFLLDCSFPMLVKLSALGEKRLGIRFSEYESIETVYSMKGLVDWVWIDCFTRNPLTKEMETTLHTLGFKLCFVSPELQQQPEKIAMYTRYFQENIINLDAVCTKHYNFTQWKPLFRS